MASLNKLSLVVLFACAVLSSTKAKEHRHINDNFMLSYELQNDNKGILFEIEAKTPGWVAIGINNATVGTMFGTDFFMGNYSDGKPNGVDCYVAVGGRRAPVPDTVSNWVVRDGSEVLDTAKNITTTKISVYRLLDTLDTQQDVKIENKTINLLWAYNIASDSMSEMHEHDDEERRGVVQVNLLVTSPTGTTTTASPTTAGSINSAEIGVKTLLVGIVLSIFKRFQ